MINFNIIYKITPKLKLNGTEKFIFNAKTVHPNLSLAEAGMTNNANIFIIPSRGINGNSKQKSNDSESESSSEEKEKSKQLSCVNYITVNFRNISQNGNLPIIFDENITIGKALKTYLERRNLKADSLVFIFNGRQLKLEDNTCLRNIISIDSKGITNNENERELHININVVRTDNMIGA